MCKTMDDAEFSQIIAKAMEDHPFWFEGSDGNEKVSSEEMEMIEASRAITYPEQYKNFIMKYGAGEFAFTNIYSPKAHGEWSSWVDKVKYNLPEQFIPVSDNGCGDYLGFIVSNGMCGEALFWCDHEQDYEISKNAEYANFYCFVVKQGLST